MKNQYEHPIRYHCVPNIIWRSPLPELLTATPLQRKAVSEIVKAINNALRAFQAGNKTAYNMFESIALVTLKGELAVQIRAKAIPGALARTLHHDPNWERFRNITTLTIEELFEDEAPKEPPPPVEPIEAPEPEEPKRKVNPAAKAGLKRYQELRKRAKELDVFVQGMKGPEIKAAIDKYEQETGTHK